MPKLTQLTIRGLRSCIDVPLQLPDPPLVVLIGPNMSGKSSVLDAVRLLRAAATESDAFAVEVKNRGGLATLASPSTSAELSIEAVVGTYKYRVTLSGQDAHPHVHDELNVLGGNMLFHRREDPERFVAIEDGKAKELPIDRAGTVLGLARGGPPASVREALKASEVYSSFRTEPGWVATPAERGEDPRAPTFVGPAPRLHPRGLELANTLSSIREDGDARWRALLDDLRFGFPFVDALSFPAVAGGRIMMKWRDARRGAESYAEQMSDGMLAYLMMLAAIHSRSAGAVTAFDEPEMHLHPSLMGRIVGRLEERAEAGDPVLIATHSDGLLDHLHQPARAVRVCENVEGRTTLRALDEKDLRYWLETYRMSELRQRGQLDKPNELP